MGSLGSGISVRRVCVWLLVVSAASLALFGPGALADQGDINTIRLEPGATTAEQQAAIDAAVNQVGADYVTSDNVQFIRSIPLAADGVGARVVGNYLYVTSTKDLEIYDISAPADPKLMGTLTLDVEFENEQVPTDGAVLGISGQTPSLTGAGVCPSFYPTSSVSEPMSCGSAGVVMS
jgi:hypothetical protein